MNKKKFGIICGIIALAILVIYLIFNSSWITHPKYMIDKQYCEVDSDCTIQGNYCTTVNIYNSKESSSRCELYIPGTKCLSNQCVAKNFGGEN